jgi:hypothetical protein
VGHIVVSRAVLVAAQRDVQSLVWRELELSGGLRIDVARVDSAGAATWHLRGMIPQ